MRTRKSYRLAGFITAAALVAACGANDSDDTVATPPPADRVEADDGPDDPGDEDDGDEDDGDEDDGSSSPDGDGSADDGATNDVESDESAIDETGGEADLSPIKIGAVLDFTGPFAAATPSFRDGLEAWAQHVNESGGLHGRTVELVYEDGQADPTAAAAATTKLIAQDGVFAIACVLGSAAAVAAADEAERENVIVLPCAYSDQLFEPVRHNVFVAATPYAAQMARAVEVMAAEYEVSDVAVVYSSDEFGESSRRGAEAAFDAIGLHQVTAESFDRGAQDLQAQARNVMRNDPDLVVCACVFSQSGLLAQAMDRLGGGEIPIVAPNPTVGPPFFVVAGESGGSVHAADYVAHAGTAGWEVAAAAMQAAHDRDPNSLDLLGLLNLAVLTESIQEAGPAFDTESVIGALEAFDEREIPGLAVPVTFSSERRFAAESVAVYRAAPETNGWLSVAEVSAPSMPY